MRVDLSRSSAGGSQGQAEAAERRERRRVRVAVAIGVALALVVAVVLARPVAAAYHLSVGSYSLERARVAAEPDVPLAAAAVALENARRLDPGAVIVLRRLAEVYGLQGRHEEAVTVLEQARAADPRSPLVSAALAEAYAAVGRAAEADALYAVLGRTPEALLVYADQFFAQGRYAEAVGWYERAAAALVPLPDDARFRRLVALSNLPAEQLSGDLDLAGALALGTGEATLDGALLRMLQPFDSLGVSYGMSLDEAFQTTGNPSPAPSGLLWLNSAAGLVVAEAESSEYLVRIVVRHRGDPPAELALFLDGAQLMSAAVAPPAGEWQTLEQRVALRPGLHVIAVQFLNPLFVQGGEDRKLEIMAVSLRKLP